MASQDHRRPKLCARANRPAQIGPRKSESEVATNHAMQFASAYSGKPARFMHRSASNHSPWGISTAGEVLEKRAMMGLRLLGGIFGKRLGGVPGVSPGAGLFRAALLGAALLPEARCKCRCTAGSSIFIRQFATGMSVPELPVALHMSAPISRAIPYPSRLRLRVAG